MNFSRVVFGFIFVFAFSMQAASSVVYLKMCEYLTVDPVARRCSAVALGEAENMFLRQGGLPADYACIAVGYAALRAFSDDPGADRIVLWDEVIAAQDDACGALLRKTGALKRYGCDGSCAFEQSVLRLIKEHEDLTLRALCQISGAAFPLQEFEMRSTAVLERLGGIGFFRTLRSDQSVFADSFSDSFLAILCDLGVHPLHDFILFWNSVVASFLEQSCGSEYLALLHKSFDLSDHVGKKMIPLYERIRARLQSCRDISGMPELDLDASGTVDAQNSLECDGDGVYAEKKRRECGADEPSLERARCVEFGDSQKKFSLYQWLAFYFKDYKERFNRAALSPLVSF